MLQARSKVPHLATLIASAALAIVVAGVVALAAPGADASGNAPSAPGGVTASRDDNNKQTIKVSWTPVDDMTYNVNHTNDDKRSWQRTKSGHICNNNGCIYNIHGTWLNADYTFAVQACNASNQCSGWTNSNLVSGAGTPNPPSVVHIKHHGSWVHFWWPKPHGGASKYDLVASKTHKHSWWRLFTGYRQNAAHIKNTNADKTYYVAVRSCNSKGCSSWRNSAAAKPPPGAVGNLRTVTSTTHGTSGGSITATWNAGKNAAGYNVNYRADGGQWQRIQSDVKATTHTGTVTVDAMHTVAVQSANANGGSAWENHRPAWLRVTDVRTRQASLLGTGIAITGLDVYYKKSNAPQTACDYVGLSLGSAQIKLTSLTPGKKHVYGIYEDSGCTNKLADATFTTLAELDLESVSQNSAKLRLAGHKGNWYYQANAGPDNTCKGPVLQWNSQPLSGLTPGETYTYTAYGDSTCSTPVAALTFTTGPYVSNLGLASKKSLTVNVGSSIAIGFRTGGNTNGYSLKSVTIAFEDTTGTGTSDISVNVYGAQDGTGDLAGYKKPKDSPSLCALSGASPDKAGNYVFSCATALSLAKDTDYFVVLTGEANSPRYHVVWTNQTNEENVPSGFGWLLHDRLLTKNETQETDWAHSSSGQPNTYKTGVIKVAATAKKPENVSGLSVINSTGHWNLSWNEQSSQADSYEIESKAHGESSWTTRTGTTDEESQKYAHATVPVTKKTNFRVQACNQAGCSGWVETGLRPTANPTSKPSWNPAGYAAIGKTSMSVFWTDVTNAAYYHVVYGTSSNALNKSAGKEIMTRGKAPTSGGVNTGPVMNKVTVTGLNCGTAYWFDVAARNANAAETPAGAWGTRKGWQTQSC